ncbi:MAG: aminopeptidase P family protein [Nitrospirota bacterium]|nr:MAG: aminopeptidase P family protein [Nitrospirota bacterium]
MARRRLDGILISDMTNIRYLTGFPGSTAMLFIGRDNVLFFTDFRYKAESEMLWDDEEPLIIRTDYFKEVRKRLKSLGVRHLGLEYGAPYHVFEKMKKHFGLKAVKGLVEKMRLEKTAGELHKIELAVKRAENAFIRTKREIRVGAKENRIALALEVNLKKEGCMKLPFDIIVASGKNSALPHARVTEKKLEKGDLVLIDWGAEADGFMSDMTRTFLMRGDNISEKKRIYNTVLKANKLAIDAVREGEKCSDIDSAARSYIEERGFGDHFSHGTGHGVGLNVHEGPSISTRSAQTVRDGMVFTIEPGIYIPGVGGVRIEDMVSVSGGRRKCLTGLPKNLEIL